MAKEKKKDKQSLKKDVWNSYSASEKKALEKLCLNYRNFLSQCKTERECVKEIIMQAEKCGYKDLNLVLNNKEFLHAGDKVYAVCMKKSVVLFNIGSEPLENGMNILGAHIDSPRLDIKQNPLYEDGGLAYMDTHYYGGIKKYQWLASPLAIHGVIVKKDGNSICLALGEQPDDPVFCISDLLPHLAQEQVQKKAAQVIEGENLDLICGSIPLQGEEKNAVLANVLRLIAERYGVEEEDFVSAELEIVPAGPAREAGFDRSMILAYGQDDRVCAYTSLVSLLDAATPQQTACCYLVDKEETGSIGATGAQSAFFENTVAELMELAGCYSELALRRALAASCALSSDVSAAYDPLFGDVYSKRNSAFLGGGLAFNKYTGSRGKNGANDANAEYLGEIRRLLDAAQVCYQTAEMGKVDAGGGGTISYLLAKYGMQVVDCGVPVISMHAPWELTSKADIFEAKRGYDAFLAATAAHK